MPKADMCSAPFNMRLEKTFKHSHYGGSIKVEEQVFSH